MNDSIDPPVVEMKHQDDEEEAAPVPLGAASEETRGAVIGCATDFANGYIRC